MHAYIALDVGGTQIKSGMIRQDGSLLSPAITHSPSYATEDRTTILDHLYHVIISQIHTLPDSYILSGVGIAFPGPFDYEKGICLIQGINKYDSIYGVNLKTYLLERLLQDATLAHHLSPNFDVRFANDASLYALGETVVANAPTTSRCLCLCIGTGLGSAFLDQGHLVTTGPDVPHNGWVYDTPFLDSIIDDYISARGILNLYAEHTHSSAPDVKYIADLAIQGDAIAQQTFIQFGERFALAITGFLDQFNPTTLVIGGQISKSYPLFAPSFLARIQKQHPNLEIRLSADTSMSTLVGVIPLFL